MRRRWWRRLRSTCRSGGAVAFQFDVPLTQLKPGTYVCQVNVIDDAGGSFSFPRMAMIVRAGTPAAPATAASAASVTVRPPVVRRRRFRVVEEHLTGAFRRKIIFRKNLPGFRHAISGPLCRFPASAAIAECDSASSSGCSRARRIRRRQPEPIHSELSCSRFEPIWRIRRRRARRSWSTRAIYCGPGGCRKMR